MRVTLGELAAAADGRVDPPGAADVAFDGVANDSRRLDAGQLFVAIEDQRDGHDFVAAALGAGAAGALVSRRPAGVAADAPLVVVDDPIAALAAAATVVRASRLATVRVVGVTGSTGKTSTKDLLRAVLATTRRVHANDASFNNEIGLPITVLGAPDDVEVVVCEMGARFAGNIADLCAIARPDVGVITNIGTAHAEHLGGPEGVLRVKSELVASLAPEGLAVLPADDPVVDRLAAATRARVLRAGRAASADVRVVVLDVDAGLRARVRMETPWGPLETRLGLRGVHQAGNAALAAAVALDAGIAPAQVASGLEAAAGSAWRMELARTVGGISVLDDSYNANPQSMGAALDALAALGAPAARRIAVLGTMRELGPTSVDDHAAIGARLAAVPAAELVAVGEGPDMDALAAAATAGGVPTRRASDAATAVGVVGDLGLGAGDVVLVKASRAVGLDAVAAALRATGGEATP